MSRACDPFSQASIHIVVDGDCIWRVPLALRRGDDTTFDPVMNDPQADAVSRTHLADCKRSCGNRRCGDTMLVSKPTYHADREGLPSRTRQTLAVEPCDDLFVIISLRQGADFSDECFGITNRLCAVRPSTYLDCFCCATLPANLQPEQLRLRAFEDRDISDQQAKDALAIARCGGWSGPQSREVSGELQDLPLLVSRNSAQLLTLELGQLG